MMHSRLWCCLPSSGLDIAAPVRRRNGCRADASSLAARWGGLLSEAHLLGYGHLIEMARQLRGTAGARQITGAEVVQWATPRGDSLVLTH